MALANVLLLSQLTGHAILLILSLCLLTPMIVHVHKFNGHCLLFATGNWREDDGLFNASWASQAYCNFPIITGNLLLFVSIVQSYRLARLAYKNQTSSFLGLFCDFLLGINICAMTVISAIIITLGFINWCSIMTQRFPSCEIAAGQNITRDDEKIDTSGFYIEMGTAQFGAWGSFAIIVGITVIAVLKLINDHQVRNVKVSMYLARQKLIDQDNSGQSIDGQSTPPIQAENDG